MLKPRNNQYGESKNLSSLRREKLHRLMYTSFITRFRHCLLKFIYNKIGIVKQIQSNIILYKQKMDAETNSTGVITPYQLRCGHLDQLPS